jgi:hypothetical protein
MDPDNFSHQFSRLSQRAGLGHWHLHELRHTGASLMLAQGTDLYVVSGVLGHASLAITKDVYGHLVEGQKRAASALMSQALLGLNGSHVGSRSPRRLLVGGRAADRMWSDQGCCWRTRRDSNSQPSDP